MITHMAAKTNLNEAVSRLQVVLGADRDEASIRRALIMSKGDENKAINYIFALDEANSQRKSAKSSMISHYDASGLPQTDHSKVSSELRHSSPSFKVNCVESSSTREPRLQKGWQCLGDMIMSAFSTTSMKNVVSCGDQVHFVLPLQPFSLKNKADKSKKNSRFINKSQENVGILRIASKKIEFAKLSNDAARVLVPLLRNEMVTCEVTILECPDLSSFSIQSSYTLKIAVNVNLRLFPARSSVGVRYFQDVTVNEDDNFLQRAFIRLLYFMHLPGLEGSDQDHKPNCSMNSSDENAGNIEIEEIESIFASTSKIHDTNSVDLNLIDGKIPGMSTKLRPYQKEAVSWMVSRERLTHASQQKIHPLWSEFKFTDDSPFYVNPSSALVSLDFPVSSGPLLGGILADEMGLGKTIEVLGTVVANSFYQGSSRKRKSLGANSLSGGTLIVCPMILMNQWLQEIETHITMGTLRATSHYGQTRGCLSHNISLLQADIVLTTYGTMSSEAPIQEPYLPGPLFQINWDRIVLDEAHNIKGRTTNVSRAACLLQGSKLWAVTGTPVQNKLDDLFSLFRFLRVDPYSNYSFWKQNVLNPFEMQKSEGKREVLKGIKALLNPLLLRRCKDTIGSDGKKLLQLPPKIVTVERLTPSKEERDIYDALYKKSKLKFEKFLSSGQVFTNYASVLEIILRLRQCADHPFLIMSAPSKDVYSMKDVRKLEKKITAQGNGPLDQYAATTLSMFNDEKAVKECPICLEIIEDGVLAKCMHPVCRECYQTLFGHRSVTCCPICRITVRKEDLMTMPRDNRFAFDLKEKWQASVKTEALISALKALRDLWKSGDKQVGKAVVFSQWTGMLDILEVPLKAENFKFSRLDGSSSLNERQKILQEFGSNSTSSADILLMSLKTGGVGINLTCATHVFLMDPWWNIEVENQAMDRVHRFGQTRPVQIFKYIIENSVEEKLVAIQERKRNMIESLSLSSQESQAARLEDLKFLFS